MLDSMTPEQFNELYALHSIDPIFEDERADLRNGTLICAVLSMFDSESKAKPVDFMPFSDLKRKKRPRQKRQTAAEQKAIMSQVVALHNATLQGGR